MDKKKLFGIMPLVVALLMMVAGCTADYGEGNEGQVPIYLTATVNEGGGIAATRAGVDLQGAQLENGATFAAEFTGNSVTPASVTYTANGSGGVAASSQPYFTFGGTSTTVYAYSPSKPGGTFSVQANQSTDAAYKQSDLMYATKSLTKTGSAVAAALQFSHKMAKIIVNATLGSGVSSIIGVYLISGNRTISLTDATTCTLGSTLTDALSTGSPLTVFSGSHTSGTLQCAALIPPQVVNGNFLKITTNAGDVIYSLDYKAFATGQSYTMSVTVNSAAIGTTIDIINWNGSITVNPEGEAGGLIAVDLGLPSGTKWANMNIGATNENDFGFYFMWGDVAGHPGVTTDGYSFSWANYKWTTDGGSSFTKYTGTTDVDPDYTTLQPADDAATAYLGSPWRMPTAAEFEELLNYTEQTDVIDFSNQQFGMLFTRNGKSVFFPGAGYRSGSNAYMSDSHGYYWSSSYECLGDSYYGECLYIIDGYAMNGTNYRYLGYTIRAVQ